MKKQNISGWGNNNKILCNITKPKSIVEIQRMIKKEKKIIPRGLGRSYGDSSLQKNCVIKLDNFNKILNFDKKKGIISLQAGTTLKQLLEKTIPNRWFVPVSPGTKFLTLGGMVASNVHGKNQHQSGCLINYILEIKLLHKNKILTLSKFKNSELFNATCGGMGLTGIILELKIKLKNIQSDKIFQKSIFFSDLKKCISTIKHNKSEYSVVWLDCFSLNKNMKINSILYLGNHESKKKYLGNFKFSKSYNLNKFYLIFIKIFFSKFLIKLFNFIKFYYEKKFLKSENSISLNNFFYPLDKIKNWNKFYGDRGFIQYQFAIPDKFCVKNIYKILKILNENDLTPYLAVLKNMKKDKGVMSFSINGVSLALDIPFTSKIFDVFPRIDKFIVKNNGKVYLTKDSILDKNNFQKMYKNSKKIKKLRKKYNLENFNSQQSERLGI